VTVFTLGATSPAPVAFDDMFSIPGLGEERSSRPSAGRTAEVSILNVLTNKARARRVVEHRTPGPNAESRYREWNLDRRVHWWKSD
jgi:hypothetical protein